MIARRIRFDQPTEPDKFGVMMRGARADGLAAQCRRTQKPQQPADPVYPDTGSTSLRAGLVGAARDAASVISA
jgi:hypothetical protein